MDEKLLNELERGFCDLENRLIADIIRRIKKTGEITSTADFQIKRLTELGYSSNDIEKVVLSALNGSLPLTWEIYDRAVEKEYIRDKAIYEQLNGKNTPFTSTKEYNSLLAAAKIQTTEELTNLTKTLGVVSSVNGQMTFLPLTEFYTAELDKAMLDIMSGSFDYNSSLKKTVKKLSDSGIRVIDYASGYTSRLPVAARRSVMSGVSQMTGQISEQNADKLGTEHFEVDYHSGARPSHREWQGKVWSKDELVSVCGLGSVTGLKGANCYHDYYPFILGVSERQYTDEWLEEQNRLEDEPKDYKGKEYTAYEAKQKQRQMETSMRAQRQKIKMIEEGGANDMDITIEKARYQGQLQEYKDFSSKMGIKEQMDRVYVDGLGKVVPSERVVIPKNTTAKANKATGKGKQYTAKELDKMSEAQLRKLAEERATKYYKSGNSGISFGSTSPEEAAKKLSRAGSKTSLKKDILAIQKKTVVKIDNPGYNRGNTSFTTHAKERMEKRGVGTQDVYNALSEPLHVASIKHDTKGRPSQKYIGREATIVINPEDGNLITSWVTGSKTKKKYDKDK